MHGGRGRMLGLLMLLTVSVISSAGAAGAPTGPVALFFGDSLIGGSGTHPRSPVEPRTASQLLGWQPVVDSFGGTGYTTGGPHGKPYFNRLSHDGFLNRHYDVIVLEGGTNDAWFGSLPRLRSAAVATIRYVRLRQPLARIVLVGGYAPHGIELDRYRQMDQVLADVAAQLGLQYVSQFRYSDVTDRSFLSEDRFHPSAKGYRIMGADLARAIKAG